MYSKKASPLQPVTSLEALLTSAEVCALLNVSPKTLRRLCERREINFIRMSRGTFRFRKTAVELFLADREVRAA
jgi:excisionase family DNA binding protein